MSNPFFSLTELQKIYDFNNALFRELMSKSKDGKLNESEAIRLRECAYFCFQIDRYVRIPNV